MTKTLCTSACMRTFPHLSTSKVELAITSAKPESTTLDNMPDVMTLTSSCYIYLQQNGYPDKGFAPVRTTTQPSLAFSASMAPRNLCCPEPSNVHKCKETRPDTPPARPNPQGNNLTCIYTMNEGRVGARDSPTCLGRIQRNSFGYDSTPTLVKGPLHDDIVCSWRSCAHHHTSRSLYSACFKATVTPQ